MHLVREHSPQEYLRFFAQFDEKARFLELTPADRNLAWREITEDEHFTEWPVPMAHFLSDPYYVGEDIVIRNTIRDFLVEFWGPELGYELFIVIAGLGVGKSFSATLCLLYAIYQLGCLKKPARYLSGFEGAGELSGDAEIVLMNASGGGYKQAQKIVFKEALERVVRSPWFRVHFEPYEGQTELEFPNRVRLSPGTSHWESVLGWNLYGFIIDEAAFGVESKKVDYIKELFNNLNLRRKSRFGRAGFGGLFTSPGSEYGFIEVLAADRRDPHILVKRTTTWDAKEELQPGAEVFLLDRNPDRVRIVAEGLTYVRPGVCRDAEGNIVRYGKPAEPEEPAEEAA